ncbi:Hypothetical predicted protein [Octopus vulgaris]|uniref:Uncharacterized protein n=1 Tax=Octopus vulgaris TaxID=6645 RepID=A0AA36FH98_OCTVU|nr:Hypothetical predicted protein [Octopus vulgaris]
MQQMREAVQTIERAWLSSRDRKIFKLLKHAVCAAEQCITSVFLQTISPHEAELLQDPTMFGGRTFPPLVYFKIFLHQNGPVIKYLSGKTMMTPAATEANEDSLKIKGPRLFFDQLLYDQVQHHCRKTTDFVDVVTLKDYMQYLAHIDETPAKYGGKYVPRHIIFYDIVEFLYSGKVSPDIQHHLTNLLVKPVNPKIQMLHLNIISALKSSISYPLERLMKCPEIKGNKTKRRSKRAVKKVNKMRELYLQEQERQEKSKMSQYSTPQTPENSISLKPYSGYDDDDDDSIIIASKTSDFVTATVHTDNDDMTTDQNEDLDPNDMDNEALRLYQWTQHLSLDNILNPSRLSL